jgi:hypothetical protein
MEEEVQHWTKWLIQSAASLLHPGVFSVVPAEFGGVQEGILFLPLSDQFFFFLGGPPALDMLIRPAPYHIFCSDRFCNRLR